MIKWLLCCRKKSIIQPETIAPSIVEQLDAIQQEYYIFSYQISNNIITTLTPDIMDTINRKKAHVNGLLNELYVKTDTYTINKYTRIFNTLESSFTRAIRYQYKTDRLRISPSLIKRKDICDIMEYNTKPSFSAEF